MKAILVPHGSAGDIHPFAWLGSLLKSRGHEVTAITVENFAPIFQSEGIKTILTGTSAEFEAIADNPDLWHPEKGFELITRLLPLWTRKTYPAIASEIISGKTIILGGSLAYGARIASEVHHVPMISVHLQPCMFMSFIEPPILMAKGEWVKKIPKLLLKGLYQVAHLKIDRALSKPINDYRAELGLCKPVSGFMRNYWMSPDGVLALFPEWFGSKQPDWPSQTFVSRFPLYDEKKQRPASSQLLSFLNNGAAPLLFTPGSANKHARSFFDTAVEVCAHLNMRGVFLTPYHDQLPSHLPDYIFHDSYAPFSQVFPKCAAVVHHGGIGTTAQALSAGVPQLIMAMGYDQPDNGYRLKKIGVGDYLYPKNFRTPQIISKLSDLLQGDSVKSSCKKYQLLSQVQMTEENVFSYIEEVFQTRATKNSLP